jgi:hypothetical protein
MSTLSFCVGVKVMIKPQELEWVTDAKQQEKLADVGGGH